MSVEKIEKAVAAVERQIERLAGLLKGSDLTDDQISKTFTYLSGRIEGARGVALLGRGGLGHFSVDKIDVIAASSPFVRPPGVRVAGEPRTAPLSNSDPKLAAGAADEDGVEFIDD